MVDSGSHTYPIRCRQVEQSGAPQACRQEGPAGSGWAAGQQAWAEMGRGLEVGIWQSRLTDVVACATGGQAASRTRQQCC